MNTQEELRKEKDKGCPDCKNQWVDEIYEAEDWEKVIGLKCQMCYWRIIFEKELNIK